MITDVPTSLDLYLTEIGETALLSAADEAALAARRDAGDTTAIHELATANARLVVHIARIFRGRLPMDEAISFGNIGLLRAAKDYHPPNRFSTYAYAWIRQAIQRGAGDTGRTIRLPIHLVELLSRIHRERRQWLQTTGTEPTSADLAALCNCTAARIERALTVSREAVSLEADITDGGRDEPMSLIDILGSDPTDAMDAAIDNAALRAHIEAALARLTEREAAMVRARWLAGEPQTLEVVGREHGVTRERARQVLDDAMARLRRSPELRQWWRDEEAA